MHEKTRNLYTPGMTGQRGEEDPAGTITRLVAQARVGDEDARDRLFERVDGELRDVARSMLRAHNIRPAVLRGTELVNAACARLLGKGELCAEDRAHFFFLLGRAMRDTIVEEARRAGAAKRGGGVAPVPLLEIAHEDGRTESVNVVDLRDALEKLRERDPECARVLEYRFFVGRTLRETAEIMSISLHSARQHTAYGTAWLRVYFEENAHGGTPPAAGK